MAVVIYILQQLGILQALQALILALVVITLLNVIMRRS